MDKLEDKTVYLNIAFDPSSPYLKIIMSDRQIAADVDIDIDEYSFEIVSDQRISFIDKSEGHLTLMTEISVL